MCISQQASLYLIYWRVFLDVTRGIHFDIVLVLVLSHCLVLQ